MNEHLQDLKSGGRPMTKLELANKEIERLNNQLDFIKDQNKYIDKLEKMVKERNSIIKELRKYLVLNIRVKLNEEFGETMQYKTIYEILDKVEENK